MNKFIRKCLAVSMAVMTITSSAIPTMAATVYKDSTASVVEDISGSDVQGNDTNQNKISEYAEYSEDTSANTDVYVTQKSTFSVIAPVVAVLNGTAGEVNSGDVTYKVYGNIAADEVITVEPEASFQLHQAGKDDITCTIKGKNGTAKTEFTYADGIRNDVESALSQEYTITAENMTAGSWNGSYNTNISLEQSKAPAGYTVLYEYDLSATDADDVKAYYCVPNANTTPIEVETETTTGSANLLSSIVNLFTPMTAYAAENNVIEYNGIRYELSDDDTLVINGTGEMKENVYGDLVDYKSIQIAVLNQFPDVGIYKYHGNNTEKDYYISWEENGLYPHYCSSNKEYENILYETEDEEKKLSEINNYVDTIKNEYIVSLPKSVIIKDGVTNISEKAFYNCTNLKNVTIGSSVTSIDNYAFYKCTDLQKITIPDSVISIQSNAFGFCSNLTVVEGMNSVETILNNAFYMCSKLKDITFGNNLKTINSSAFNNCSSLTEIYIPATVSYLVTGVQGKNTSGTFQGCNNLKNINVDENNITYCSIDGVLYSKDKSVLIRYPQGKTNSEYAIPSSVKTIYDEAFDSCSNLTKIAIPDSVISIRINAFHSCDNLADITIPCSVTSLANYIFDECSNLTSINIDENNQYYSSVDGVLFNKDKTKLIRYPEGNARSEYTVPDTVITIGQNAFYDCENLANIILPNSVNTIESYAFSYCGVDKDLFINPDGFTITVPNSITSIGSSAFNNMGRGSTIYCQSQEVASLLQGKYTASKSTVVVDASKFA